MDTSAIDQAYVQLQTEFQDSLDGRLDALWVLARGRSAS